MDQTFDPIPDVHECTELSDTVDSTLIDISRLDLCEEFLLLLLADNLHRCTMRGDDPAKSLVEFSDLDGNVLANQRRQVVAVVAGNL